MQPSAVASADIMTEAKRQRRMFLEEAEKRKRESDLARDKSRSLNQTPSFLFAFGTRK